MRVALCYPYIYSKEEELLPTIERFFDSGIDYPPGADHDLVLELSEAPLRVWSIWDGDGLRAPNVKIVRYYGGGRDIGAHQHAANSLAPEIDFAVFCSSQVHFHRAGWLARIIEARTKHGPGLYGAMGSFENNPHIRTCFFGCDPLFMRRYPNVINSREKSLEFESGPQNFSLWVDAQGGSVRMVTWSTELQLQHCRDVENGFRIGDQSNCLVWDRHTEIYAKADPELQAGLRRSADGLK